MKKSTIIKQLFFAGILITGMNIYSSCDSCNRKQESTEENTTYTGGYESTTEDDTIIAGDNSGTVNDGSTSSTSISISSGTKNKNATNTTTVNTTKTTTTSTSSKDEEARQQAITDAVENSDAKSAINKSGKPIRSSGDAGSGTGTGTGSTGNNSRVTTREAQKSN